MTNNLQGKISLTNTLKGGQILHKGPKGETGLSAYEIALKNGYEGTEKEWLNSLKGDDGEKGEKGDPTATIEINRVVTGEAGTDAKVENVGTDVNLKLDITIPRGDKGEQGLQGNPGENGLDGYTPIKGTDYFTDSEIQTIKQEILNDISSFDLLVVESLPTSDIKEKTIYLVPNAEQQEDNVYDEYIYVNSKWEVIGSTAIDPTKLKVNLIEKSYKVTLTEKVEAGGTITLPANYKVGSDRLDVFFNGEKLIKAIDDDSQGHYYEVGTEDMSSNTIKLTSDWYANVGDVFEFSIRTNGEGQAEEVVVDSIPIGTIIDYEGDTVPEGYEEVEDKGEVYSTEEVRIGTWIDGKPLYRKVINLTAPICEKDGTYVSKMYNISNNVDFAVIELGFIKDEYNQIQTFPYINNSGNCIKAFVDLNKKINLVHNINSYSSKEVTVSVEYTKTTD